MKSKTRIFSIFFFLSLICLTPMLSGCFTRCGQLFGFKATSFEVYICGSDEPIKPNNKTIVVKYGEVEEDLKSYIKIKEVNIRNEKKEPTEDFRIETSCPINSETLPGLYGIYIYYMDLEPQTIFINITGFATEITLNLSYTNEYGRYELPTVNEDTGRDYILYYSTDRYGRDKQEWTSNTQLAPGYYYGWAEMEATPIYGPGSTYPEAFTVVETSTDIPTISTSYTYTGNTIMPEFENCDENFVDVIATSQTIPGKYTARFRLKNYIHWSDGTTEEKTLTWTIDKAVLNVPTVINSLTYNGTSQNVAFSDYDDSLIEISGTLCATNAGIYTASLKLKNHTCYVWDNGNTITTHVNWTIEKAQTSPVEFSKNIIIKKGSELNFISNFLEENYSLYNYSKLPSGVNISDSEWTKISTQEENNHTITLYSSSAQKGVYWIKEESKYTYSSRITTTYYQGGIIDGDVNNIQHIYLSYTQDPTNYHPAPVQAGISVKEKTLHTISLDEQSINSSFTLNETTNRYEIVYNKTTNTFIDANSSTPDYKIVYKNTSKDNEITNSAKDVGIYEVWAQVEEDENNYAVTTNKILIEVLSGQITELTNIVASEITFSQKLNDSTITASANYHGQVEGVFNWLSPDTMPQVSDSNLTIYSFTFTPNDTNILPFVGQTTLTVNRAQITSYIEPTINENKQFYADAFVSDIKLGAQGEAYFNELLLEGKWHIESSGKRIQNTFNLVFTPNDDNYDILKVAKDSSNTSNLVNINSIRFMAKPTYAVIFKDNDTFRFWQDGTATFRTTYSSGYFTDRPIKEIDDFIIHSQTSYELKYAGITSKSYTANNATAVNDIDELENVLTNTTGNYYFLSNNIKLTRTLTTQANTPKVVIVPSGITLDFDEFSIDFTNFHSINCILNCGTLLNSSTTTAAITNLKTIENYGEISLTHINSSKTTINNYSNVTFVEANTSINVTVNNLTPSSNLTIEEREAAILAGENYGTVTCKSNNTTLNNLTNHTGATFTAGRTALYGNVKIKANSAFNADVYINSNYMEYEVTSLEKFIEAVKILSLNPRTTKIVIYNDIDLTNCQIIVDGTENATSTALPLYSKREITIIEGANLNLGGKNLVLYYTENEDESRVNGEGTISNGTISYNHEGIGSVYTETHVVTCKAQSITYENLNKNEITATSQNEFIDMVSRYNGLDVNITADCNISLTKDIAFTAPLKITIPAGRTFNTEGDCRLTMNYNEQGQFPQFIIYGTFYRPSTKIMFTQYETDYNTNGFNSTNSFSLVDSGSFVLNPNSYYAHYIIKDVRDLSTFKTLAATTSYTIMNLKELITFDSDITLSKHCWIKFDLESSSGSLLYGINLNGYDLTLSWENINTHTKIDNVEMIYSTVSSSDLYYKQTAERLVKMYNSGDTTLGCDAFNISKLSSTINSANLSIQVTTYEQLKIVLKYATIYTSCLHFVDIQIKSNFTLADDVSLVISSKYKVYLTIWPSTTLNLGGYTLSLPNIYRPSYSGGEIYTRVYLKSGATITNGNIKIPDDSGTSFDKNTFIVKETGATLTNITYVYF